MHEVFRIFLISTISIALWTVFILLNDKRGNRSLNLWFSAFLVALSAPLMDLYASHTQQWVFHLSVVASSFLWLKGPFIHIFICVLCRKDSSLKKVWPHFIPWFIALSTVLLFPNQFMSVVMLGMGHMCAYLLYSIYRLTRRREYIVTVWQGFKNTAYYWLLYITWGVMLLVALDFSVMSMVMMGVIKTYNFLDYFVFPTFSVFVLSIGVLSVYRPELFFRAAVSEEQMSSESDEQSSIQNVDDDALKNDDQGIRYLALDNELAQTLNHQLSVLMDENKEYLKNELSLPELAENLGISTHQLSELLNVHKGKSFYEYINGYRLKHACHLLDDSGCRLRIIDVAFESGFNNKNSFYRAFKQGLGLTPLQYRQQSIAEELAVD